MSTWPANSLPITHTLAKEFAVFDRWFASMPGPTLPNRQFLHSATSNGVTDHLFMKYAWWYYDHVPTPLTGVPSPDGIVGNAGERGEGFRFDRLGIRVPTWTTSASQFEHSSIPGFLKRHFKLDNYLTKRDEWAGAIEPALVQLKSPRMDCPLKLPEVISGKWVPNSPIGSNDDGEEHVGPEDPISADEGYLSTEARLIGNEVKDLLINIRNRDKTGQPDV
ncbi:hypothetical protein BDF22DRAFT_651982 [Syncephalis plumigaleata]|nr:hypothetical protein BDF22DRAFT_651982 [Syncephalis plumigaleata]